jgi:hypothetical protein
MLKTLMKETAEKVWKPQSLDFSIAVSLSQRERDRIIILI